MRYPIILARAPVRSIGGDVFVADLDVVGEIEDKCFIPGAINSDELRGKCPYSCESCTRGPR